MENNYIVITSRNKIKHRSSYELMINAVNRYLVAINNIKFKNAFPNGK